MLCIPNMWMTPLVSIQAADVQPVAQHCTVDLIGMLFLSCMLVPRKDWYVAKAVM